MNFEKVHHEPVLLCFNRTAYAAKLEKMSDDAVVDEAMRALRRADQRPTTPISKKPTGVTNTVQARVLYQGSDWLGVR